MVPVFRLYNLVPTGYIQAFELHNTYEKYFTRTRHTQARKGLSRGHGYGSVAWARCWGLGHGPLPSPSGDHSS